MQSVEKAGGRAGWRQSRFLTVGPLFSWAGVEFFKIQAAKALGPEKAWKQRNNIYLGSAACAEFIADVFLCPLEATRIRLVSNPTYAPSMASAMAKMAKEEGILGGFYAGFGPILFKQVPYTMAKFAGTLSLPSADKRARRSESSVR